MSTNYSLSLLLNRNHIIETIALWILLVATTFFYSASANTLSHQSVLKNTQQDSVILSNEIYIDHSSYPSITAILNKYHERNPENVSSNWISLSPMGMRVRDVFSRSEVIKNFSQQRVWLVNGMNRTRYEVDIDFYKRYFPEQLPNLLGAESISNIASSTPCADLTSSRLGERFWRGQVVEEWRCSTEDGELYSTQLFSARWNLVVQVKHRDMSIEELIDIKEESYSVDYFLPVQNMAEVEFEEFMTGRRHLDTYSQ